MAKTGKFNELECNTPEARLTRIENTLIELGRVLDTTGIYFGIGEKRMKELLNIKGDK